MQKPTALHQTVLLNEAVAALNIKADGYYVDATFGRGGHSKAILEQLSDAGRLLAIDRDPEAVSYAQTHFADDKRFSIVHKPFVELAEAVQQTFNEEQPDGILFDLGVSSPQLDDAERGFSFLRDGPLDMRMDTQSGITVAQYLTQVSEAELVTVLKQYGEERFAKRIAKAIMAEQQQSPITTTKQLAEIVAAANPKWEKHKHPATRSFQALRIAVNEELSLLQPALEQAFDGLKIGGRLVVISFHSLEDRIVKRYLQKLAKGDEWPRDLPITQAQENKRAKLMGKAVKPSPEEIQHNSRARSAIMRIAEKIA